MPTIKGVEAAVMTTVQAPYRGSITATEQAKRISDRGCASRHDPFVFAFFSDVDAALQRQIVAGMGVDLERVADVASLFAALSGNPLPLSSPEVVVRADDETPD